MQYSGNLMLRQLGSKCAGTIWGEVQLKTAWLICPICGNKTRDRVREDTVLESFPLFCPKCKQETLIKNHKCQFPITYSIN